MEPRKSPARPPNARWRATARIVMLLLAVAALCLLAWGCGGNDEGDLSEDAVADVLIDFDDLTLHDDLAPVSGTELRVVTQERLFAVGFLADWLSLAAAFQQRWVNGPGPLPRAVPRRWFLSRVVVPPTWDVAQRGELKSAVEHGTGPASAGVCAEASQEAVAQGRPGAAGSFPGRVCSADGGDGTDGNQAILC